MGTQSTRISLGEHLTLFIRKIIKEQKYANSVIRVNTTCLSSVVKYHVLHFKITIVPEGRDELLLFARTADLDNDWKTRKINPFKNERLFYTTLMTAYRQLEDKHEIPEEHKLKVPVCYGAEAAHEREILVLEELTSKGYGSASKTEPVNWQYAAAAITELAKFHALSLAYQKENPTEFDDFSKQLPEEIIEKDKENSSAFASFRSLAVKTVRDENKQKLKSFLKSNDLTSYNDMLKPLDLKVIVHGHFWPKSIMHKVLDDGTVEVITLGYYGIQVGSPVTDLLYFIYTATDAPFRESHYQALVQHYQAELIKAASRLGLDIEQEYSHKSLESEMTEKLPYGLLTAMMYLPALYLGPADEEARAVAVETYIRRLNEAVDDFACTPVLADQQPSKGKPCGMCFLC